MTRLRFFPRRHSTHERFTRDLDAFATGQPGATRREAFEAHLAGCASCTERLADIRALRAALRALPEPALPRSFYLTPEMAERAQPLRLGASAGLRLAQGMAALAVLAVLAFAIVVAADFADDEGGQRASPAVEASLAVQAGAAVAEDSNQAAAGGATAQPTAASRSALPSPASSVGGAGADPQTSPTASVPVAPATGPGDDVPAGGDTTSLSTAYDGTGATGEPGDGLFAATKRDDGGLDRDHLVAEVVVGAVALLAVGGWLGVAWRRRML